MTDADALLAAIRLHPAEDVPRLMYADEIEAAQPDRAEFIRVQCELANTPAEIPPGSLLYRRSTDETPIGLTLYPTPNVRHLELRDRERALCGEGIGRRDGRGIKPRFHAWAEAGGIDPRWVSAPGFGDQGGISLVRGFFERLTLPAADWLAHADRILAAHPVTRVRLTTWPAADALTHDRVAAVYRMRVAGRVMEVTEEEANGNAGMARLVLSRAWPGVAFELLPERMMGVDWAAGHDPVGDLRSARDQYSPWRDAAGDLALTVDASSASTSRRRS